MPIDYGPIFDDNDSNIGLLDIERDTGYMDRNPDALGSPMSDEEFGAAFNVQVIPESEWDAIIRQQEDAGTTLKQLCEQMGLPPKNQGSLPYCWVFAPTHCCEIIRLRETGRVMSYSPASCGAFVKNFRRVGGWGTQALERMKSHGINLSEDWPDTAVSRRLATEENKQKASRHKALEYASRLTWVQRGTLIIRGIPTADGYPWWGHEVIGCGITVGLHDLVIRNSWGKWGDGNGFGVLRGRKKHAGDSCAVAAMKPI